MTPYCSFIASLFRREQIKRNFGTRFSVDFHCLKINRLTENIDTSRVLTICGKGTLADQFKLGM